MSRALLLLVMVLGLSACAVGPDYVRQPLPTDKAYAGGHNSATTATSVNADQHLVPGQRPVPDWWKAFHSTALNDVVADGLQHSPATEQAQAVLEQANDNLKAGEGVFYPQVDLGLSAERQRASPYRLGVNGGKSSVFNLFTLSGSVSYVLDVFGGERRAVEALGAQVDQQRALYAASRLSLSGNIVNTTIADAAYADEVKLLHQLLLSQEESIALLDAQVRAGTATTASLFSLQSQVATNEASLPQLAQKQSAAEHLLASLTGHAPGAWSAPVLGIDQLSLPSSLPLSLPSDVVRQRPDIVAAESVLHMANAEVGVSTAALFPSFSLTGSYGLANSEFSQLGSQQSRFWSAGPSINFPIFSGGTVWYQRKAAQAAYREVLAEYRQTVLAAFAQVADVLSALDHDGVAASDYQKALNAARAQDDLVHANYSAGLVAGSTLLNADQQVLTAQINLLQVQALRLQDTVALYTALGGGWQEDGGVVVVHDSQSDAAVQQPAPSSPHGGQP